MPKPLVAGNWKMHFTVPVGLRVTEELLHHLHPYAQAVEVVLLPPAIMLWEVAHALQGSGILVGAQNAWWADQGPFTGEISPSMLAGWCHYLLIGHSERRQLFGETDEELNRKLKAGLKHHLEMILAVGETLEEHDAGRTEEVVTRQLRAALFGLEPAAAGHLSIAYEPIWAIGTGRAATPDYANSVMGMIRELLAGEFADAGQVRILYGGSVTAANAPSLMEQPNIHGALVGGASLKPEEFARIVQAAAKVQTTPA